MHVRFRKLACSAESYLACMASLISLYFTVSFFINTIYDPLLKQGQRPLLFHSIVEQSKVHCVHEVLQAVYLLDYK